MSFSQSSILYPLSSFANYKCAKVIIFSLLILLMLTACRQDMHDQPRLDPLEVNTFFKDGRASRQLVQGTVPRGHLKLDDHFYTGKVNGELVSSFPFPISKEIIKKGQERYDIFCTPCHDYLGYGNGMIVQRGFRPPPALHIERLRLARVGHFFDVMTNGLGAMYDYADRISAKDRWAIIAYIRVLQLSQNMSIEEVPQDIRRQLLNRK